MYRGFGEAWTHEEMRHAAAHALFPCATRDPLARGQSVSVRGPTSGARAIDWSAECYDRAMRSPLLVLGALCLLGAPAARAASDQVRVERVSGESVGAQRMTGIADGNVVLVADSGELKVPLADVIQIGFGIAADPPQAYGAKEVAVDLGSGESLLGEIKAGDERGLTLATPLLGNVVLSLDHIANVRFLRRLAQMPEPPDLSAA